MRHRKLLYFIVPVLAFAAYMGAFYCVVDIAHVTYAPSPGPRPPQFVMYVSDTSDRANVIAHWIFAPIIFAFELSGDYGYLDEAPHLGL